LENKEEKKRTKEARLKKKKAVKHSLTDRIENVEKKEDILTRPIKHTNGRPIKQKEDVQLVVPFNIASRLNQNVNIRTEQNFLRKELCVFLREHFPDFVKGSQTLLMSEDPGLVAVGSRLFVEALKIVLPRPRELDSADISEDKKNIIKKLLGV
jgi:hypothetical protein